MTDNRRAEHAQAGDPDINAPHERVHLLHARDLRQHEMVDAVWITTGERHRHYGIDAGEGQRGALDLEAVHDAPDHPGIVR